jgi:hypothetical protein
VHDNLHQFSTIAEHASELEVTTCITSFVDHYRKVQRRFNRRSKMALTDPPLQEKISTITELANQVEPLGINLQLCCEKDLLEALPPGSAVTASACISNQRLEALYGPGISLARDCGQRHSTGCMCSISKDIGSYNLQPCGHDCLFCYANPSMDHKPMAGNRK